MKVVKENRRIDVRWVLHDDGKHEVTFGDQSLVVTAVETLARITYEETLVEHDPAKELRARERAHYEMQAMRSESFARRAKAANKKGGKGGRGGV
ncbi:MAG: hypothetical protein HZY75_01365 [Nocardioidaceae bacterium]|nr:MAG: hypothetical protein HZY75_01365 [Nocardioidaceae bacterium]